MLQLTVSLQYVNPIALDAIHWKLYLVYIGTLSAMIPTICEDYSSAFPCGIELTFCIDFFFPETKGRGFKRPGVDLKNHG